MIGFALAFLILPLLAIASLIGIVGFIISRNRKFLTGMGIAWAVVAVLLLVLVMLGQRNRPIRLMKKDIVGRYRIDTAFYPGGNARWLFDRYQFIITQGDSIYWLTKQGNSTTVAASPLVIDEGPPVLWRARDINASPFFEQPPTLFRSHDRFYYVIDSHKYGNMFFRKVSSR